MCDGGGKKERQCVFVYSMSCVCLSVCVCTHLLHEKPISSSLAQAVADCSVPLISVACHGACIRL